MNEEQVRQVISAIAQSVIRAPPPKSGRTRALITAKRAAFLAHDGWLARKAQFVAQIDQSILQNFAGNGNKWTVICCIFCSYCLVDKYMP
jgi:hypothetical protein